MCVHYTVKSETKFYANDLPDTVQNIAVQKILNNQFKF